MSEAFDARSRLGAPGVALAWAVAAALVLALYWLSDADPDLYYRSVQEDEALEWATFFGFALAAAAFARAAFDARARGWLALVWAAALALFAVGVAGEEISWGQRLLGFRPPDYFLAHNFQQELNVHNVMDTDLRRRALEAVLLGYGVVLPLAAAWEPLARRVARLGVSAPPLGLAPAFVGAFWLYRSYPLRFSGEIVEALLALLWLGAGLALALGARPAMRRALALGVGVLLTAGLAVGMAALQHRFGDDDPGRVEAARRELEALRRDFQTAAAGRRVRTGCGLHRRLYTLVVENDAEALLRGEFAGLVASGLPETRAAFLLDPWNSPYWVRDECSRDRSRRTAFVYSFGPNRRRESTEWEIRGDDIGVIFRRLGPPLRPGRGGAGPVD